MHVVISGASGLIGSALVDHLRAAGHRVTRLVRSATAAPDAATWDPARGVLSPSALDGADAVVNLSGAGIGDHRWSDRYRRELLDSRTQTTGLLARTIAAVERPPAAMLSASGINWYEEDAERVLDESAPPGTGFLADVCRQWEEATGPAEEAGARTVHMRSGMVLSERGGGLRKQLPLFRLGLGGRFGSGRQWQSWISIHDEVRAMAHLLTSSLAGAVNLVAPNPVTNAEFTRTLAGVLRRPALLPIPAFGPKLVLGSELAESLLFASYRIVPARLLSDGFEFEHPTLRGALEAILDAPRSAGTRG